MSNGKLDHSDGRPTRPPGSGPLVVSRWRKWWLWAPAHLGVAMVVGLAFVGMWAQLHDWNRANYDSETEPSVVAALRQYQIVRDASTGLIELQVGGRKFSPEAAPEPGVLGLERLSSLRGVLIEAHARMQLHNQHLAASLATFRALWELRGSVLVLQLARVGIMVPPRAELRLDAELVRGMARGTLAEARVLLNAAAACRPWMPTEVPPDATVGVRPSPATADVQLAAIRRWVADRAPQILTEARKTATTPSWYVPVAVLPEQAGKLHDPFTVPLRGEIDALYRDAESTYQRLRLVTARLSDVRTLSGRDTEMTSAEAAILDRRLQSWVIGAAPADAAVTLDAGLGSVVSLMQANLQRSLYTVHQSEAGFLWFHGAWRWWEIVWWTIFGVLAGGIFNICSFSLFGKALDGRGFEPREGLCIGARLFYAPLLTVVFFWLALATDFVEEASLFATGSFGGLATAFVLGLVPHKVMAVLLQVVNVLLRVNTDAAQAADKTPPAVLVEAPAKKHPNDGIPRIADLRDKAVAIATASLR